MNIKTFKNIEQATEFILSTEFKVNQFYPIVRELEENHVVKLDNYYIFIDEQNLLN